MVFSIIAKTTQQKGNVKSFAAQPTTLGSVTIYTCPAGHTARGNLTAVINNYGTAASVRGRAGGSKVLTFVSGTDPLSEAKSVPVSLAVGQAVTLGANTGTTSEADYNLTIEEFPI